MKKNVFIVVLLVFAIQSSVAQNFKFGAVAGVNFSNINGEDLGTNEEFNDLESLTSFHLGLVSEILLGGKFYIAPELLYSAQGAKDEESDLKLNYLQIPVMGRYYFTEGFNAELGPQIGILLNTSGEVEDVKVSNDSFETTNISFAFGLGYKMTNGLFLRARYFMGSNIAKSRKSEITGDDVIDFEYFNKVTQLSVGYMF